MLSVVNIPLYNSRIAIRLFENKFDTSKITVAEALSVPENYFVVEDCNTIKYVINTVKILDQLTIMEVDTLNPITDEFFSPYFWSERQRNCFLNKTNWLLPKNFNFKQKGKETEVVDIKQIYGFLSEKEILLFEKLFNTDKELSTIKFFQDTYNYRSNLVTATFIFGRISELETGSMTSLIKLTVKYDSGTYMGFAERLMKTLSKGLTKTLW